MHEIISLFVATSSALCKGFCVSCCLRCFPVSVYGSLVLVSVACDCVQQFLMLPFKSYRYSAVSRLVRHTVGHSGHHHHRPPMHAHNGDHLDVNSPARPISPAWSLRSRTGSTQSHDTGGLFSWGRGEDGKFRFGSRRSARTVATNTTTGDR